MKAEIQKYHPLKKLKIIYNVKFAIDNGNIMNTVEKRDYIHNYLYRIDDKDIDEMFKKVQSIVEKDIALTFAQEQEIEKRVMRHKNGESKSFSWNDVKKRAQPGK